jgi:hypothetical protein
VGDGIDLAFPQSDARTLISEKQNTRDRTTNLIVNLNPDTAAVRTLG